MQTIALHAMDTRCHGSQVNAVVAVLVGLMVLTCRTVHAETRVAVIASQSAGVEKLAPLVELRLGQHKEITLLDREHSQEILREQDLGALLTAEETAKRVALGKLLKADVLILLQGETAPQPHARVTICETRQGLRLCRQVVEFSESVETDADAVLRLAAKAIEKQCKPIVDIVAVPPFANNTLAFEGDHLKAACARLIEEMLLDQPGVVVVELAEADAIARELALVREVSVERRLPLYLMGEYRLDGMGAKQKLSCALRLLRGATRLDQRRLDGVTTAELPRLACLAAAEMFSKSLGQAVKPSDAEAEGRQLAERAKLAMRLGDTEEALPLLEAALQVNPDRMDLHGDALRCLNARLSPILEKELQQNHGDYLSDSPGVRLAKAMLPMSLHHAELFMRNTTLDGTQTTFGWLPGAACNRLFVNIRWQTRREFEQSMADFQPVMAMARRVLAAKAEAKVQDPTLWLLYRYADVPINGPMGVGVPSSDWREQYIQEHLQELRERRLDLLQAFAFLKVRNCVCPGGGLDDVASGVDQSHLDFLRKAARIPCVQDDAEEDLRWLMETRVRDAYMKAHPLNKSAGFSPPNPPRKTAAPKATEVSSPEFAFHPIPFHGGNQGKSPFVLRNCMPTVEGVDLFVGEDILYLMKAKDELRPLPLRQTRKFDADNADRTPNVCFDGKFVWLLSPDPDRFLAVIDPQTERVWKYTANDGLPPMGRENGAAVTPLASGRICAAGYFGRTWCGIAEFTPEKGIALNVFFEARDVRDYRDGETPNPKRAVQVCSLHTIAIPSNTGQASEQRVLLFAGQHHTLIVDPQKPAVERVVDLSSHSSKGLFCVDDGAVYWGEQGGQPCRVFRQAYPGFQSEEIQRDGPFGPIARYDGRIYMWSHELRVSTSLHKPFRTLHGASPDILHTKPLCWCRYPLAVSRHYGLILLAPPGAYRIELLTPTTMTDEPLSK